MNRKIKKIINKSGKKLCQICNQNNILIEHHIHGRNINDYNEYWNLCNICSNCHTEVHHGIKIIEGWINTSEGLELFWHYKTEESFTGKDAKPYLIL